MTERAYTSADLPQVMTTYREAIHTLAAPFFRRAPATFSASAFHGIRKSEIGRRAGQSDGDLGNAMRGKRSQKGTSPPLTFLWSGLSPGCPPRIAALKLQST